MNLINFRRSLVAFILLPVFAYAQPVLHFKTRDIDTRGSQAVTEIGSPLPSARGHLLVQFENPPTADQVEALKRRGVAVLQDVPENGLLVSLERRVNVDDLGIQFAAPIDPADKISPLASSGSVVSAASTGVNEYFLVEFHPDVELNHARADLAGLGIELLENPDLNPHHLMIRATDSDTLAAIAALDPVAYIFPASTNLVQGIATGACLGALTVSGPAAQSIPVYGDGWDGPGLGSATVGYVFTKMTAQLAPAAAQAEIERAMSEWANVVKVTWQQGTNPNAPQTVSILWGTYAHGDSYPFDGPGGVLAHTFFPAPVNPEPIAGDMHFDDSETWRIGVNTDLFSVALHELGHALGLGHADDPSAVMYPYYKMVTGLSPLDISTVQTLYAAQTSTPYTPPTPSNPPATPPANPPAPPSTPLTMTMTAPATSTTASSVNLGGSVSDGKGSIAVTWSTGQGSSGTAQVIGTAWNIFNLPLAIGSNTIAVIATDSATHVSQSVVITRTVTGPVPAPAPAPAPTPAPAPPASPTSSSDKTSPSLTIAAPSSTSVSTSAASMVFSGTASDNFGVTAVTWTTNTGGSGTALTTGTTGTTQWSATVPLLVGSNTVTIRASDAAGNVGWRTAVVTRH